jgi:hypothetical protein
VDEERTLRRAALGIAAMVLASAMGCQREPPPQPTPNQGDPLNAGLRHISAVSPVNRAENVGLRPKFRWRLPDAIPMPTYVSFTLAPVAGPGEPISDETEENFLAKVTGLHDTSPAELDLFHPPPGAIVAGPIQERTALEPETWYRWTVRVMREEDYARANFYFRTGPASASPPAEP